jgi:predicted amidohydrolase YtcJ/predicted nucleic acid-binding protein
VIILDTNVISELARQIPDTGVLAWLDSLEISEVATTAVTAAELRYGVARLPDGHRKRELTLVISGILVEDFYGRVLPFDERASIRYADVVTGRESIGKPIGVADAQIAAICRDSGATLATATRTTSRKQGSNLSIPGSLADHRAVLSCDDCAMSSLLLRQVRLVPLGGSVAADPVDVLIEDGVIAGLGPAAGEHRVPAVDGEGRWLIPGLWDAHVHLGQWALAARRLDLSQMASPGEVLAIVARAARGGDRRPVVGMGHRAGTWARQVTVAELDAVCGEVPVVLINSDCHHGWLNTAALDALGLARRDTVVAEAEWFAAYPLVATVLEDPPAPADYRKVLERAAAHGIAGLVDFEFGAPWTDWAKRWHEGCDLLRIRWSPYADQLDSVRAAGLRGGASLPGADGRLSVGSLKIISDGSLGTRTAWCYEPYADTGGFGAPNQSAAELTELLAAGKRAGLPVATHAIGDRALDAALLGYAATGARGSIEHAQLTTREGITAMARLGLTASVQPAHLLDDRQTTDLAWAGQADRCFTLRSLRDHGVNVALGSDAPVAPLDPWLAIATAVHRGLPGDEPWHPEQAITVAEAIAASVDGRRIAVGQPGDVALLDFDPLVSDAATLRAMRAALTCVAGHVVHSELAGATGR